MCTVTFLPLTGNNFIFTSNRDIPYHREKAAAPAHFVEDEIALTYPKDGKAGGTWIGTSAQGRLICLLNGGFVDHVSKESYVKSRGIIVKELLKATNIKSSVDQIELTGVEQFTIVIVDWNDFLALYELVWDGTTKHFRSLPLKARIWSSSTLYSETVKAQRRAWFEQWQQANVINIQTVLKFHHEAGIGDPNIDVMMDRIKGGTVSVSCIEKNENQLTFYYEDVTNGQNSQLTYVV